jgi:hypothetical protein
MKNIKELEIKIRNLGFFSGKIQLLISLTSEFEGFYGKASEDWEKQVVIEIKSSDESVIKSIKVFGKRFESIDDVAGRLLNML